MTLPEQRKERQAMKCIGIGRVVVNGIPECAPMTVSGSEGRRVSYKIAPAWAIDTGEDPVGLIGHGWFGWPTEAHAAGCSTALFKTRAIARAHLRRVKGPREAGRFPKASVIRVIVRLDPPTRRRALPQRERTESESANLSDSPSNTQTEL